MSRAKSDTGAFALIPEWLLDTDVSDGAIRQYAILARHADKDTLEGWPSRRKLADRQRCSLDTVDRRNRELVDVGALEIEARFDDERQKSNLYRVLRVRPGGRKSAAGEGRVDAAGEGRTDAAQNESQTERESGEREEPSRDSEPDAFEDWWVKYPRKTAKQVARETFARALSRGASVEDLSRARDGYVIDIANRGTTEEYVLHASTFLNKERWRDYLDVKPRAPRQPANAAPSLDRSLPRGEVRL